MSTAMDTNLTAEIGAFLSAEAELLDDRRWAEWLDLLTADFHYALPLPITRDNPGVPAYVESTYLQVENRNTLDGWVERLSPERVDTAWAENPPARVRHFVTNVRPRAREGEDELDVRSNVLIAIARGNEQPTMFSAERHDVLRRDGESWKIARRKVYLDQNVPTWPMRVII